MLLSSIWSSQGRDVLLFILLILAIVWLILISTMRLGYYWQWYRIPRYLLRIEEGQWVLGELSWGLLFTLRIAAISLVFSLVIGLATALTRLS